MFIKFKKLGVVQNTLTNLIKEEFKDQDMKINTCENKRTMELSQ